VRHRSEFPRAIHEIENRWIPLSDGCRLAARIWIPEDAERDPVPALVEYLPYRKRDGTRGRDGPMHRYFAGHGYAALRIDLRGTGDSDGVLRDEYLEQEQADCVEALRWIASQPWCTGAIGMMGKSWGGFNALQVAALRPPELRAILTVCSTDDRYADDAHYMGGCLLNENLLWGAMLLTLNAFPPDPEIVGERWRAMWLERLEGSPLFAETWLRHQRRDDYWKHGSVCEDFGAIACPVYAVGGWADAYTNAVPRLLAGLRVPRKGLVGPWAHLYPHDGVPGPAIGFLQEALRWWDHWLKGHDTGIMDEPLLRVWMQDSVPPRAFHAQRPGRWVAEERWPSERIVPRVFVLRARRLLPEASRGAADVRADAEPLGICSPQSTGVSGGSWCGFGLEGEMPTDQREDDARSLVFDSEPLTERLEILGAPVLRLSLRSDEPRGLLAARLESVAPDGASARVTYGLLNLTHRGGHALPQPLAPGETFQVELALNDVAHAFAPGERLRLALSNAYWPVAWPSPRPTRLEILPQACALSLPVRPPRAEDLELRPFEEPESGRPAATTELAASINGRQVEIDDATGEVRCTVTLDLDEDGLPALEHFESIDLVRGHSLVERFSLQPDDPLSARAEVVHRTSFERGAWSTRVETNTHMSSTATEFLLTATLEAYEGEERVFARRWERAIPRDLV